ncbi:hypothetical protein HYU23_03625 [Candidatus Woesearchaeota archaeon]|nr:hypothetical protein [Candidatus Woesearchaeota archaeon]
MGKKGGYELPMILVPAVAIFTLTLIVFGILFFSTNLFKNPDKIIRPAHYGDDSKLITILKSRTEIQENQEKLIIAELISLAYTKPEYKQNLTSELNKLLIKLPKPSKGKDLAEVEVVTPKSVSASLQKANWNIKIKIEDELFLHAGEESIAGSEYFVQKAAIPITNKKIANIILYLDCFSCSGEAIDDIA